MSKVKLLMLSAAAFLLSGCAPSTQMMKYKVEEVKQLGKLQLAIIDGYYGKVSNDAKERKKTEDEFLGIDNPVVESETRSTSDRPPLPEGDNSGPPCSVKCIDNCDEQCRKECHELYAEMCGDEENIPYPDEEFDLGNIETEGEVPVSKEEIPKPEEEDKPKPESVIAKTNASGDNNNQTNIVGDRNKILVQGGAGPNNAMGNPIEKAMAQLLLQKVTALKSGGEIAAEQARMFLNDGVDGLVKLTPLSIGIGTIGAVKTAIKEAGDKDSNNPYYDLSDNSTNISTAPEPVVEEVLE